MIHEDDLRALLAEAAEAVPPPGRAPQALLDAVAEQAAVAPARQVPRVRLAAIAASVVLVVALGAALVSTDESSDVASSGVTFEESGAAIGSGTGSDADGFSISRSTLSADEGTMDAPPAAAIAGDGAGGGGSGPVAADASPFQSAEVAVAQADSAKIVKTGSLDLEVREGAFDGVVDRITAQAIGLGGYIAESTTNESSDRPSGSLVVRVPAESFDSLLTGVRKLGDVKAASAKGTDVTAQFTDLAARLTALSATRDRLSAVLADAKNVPDILAVQDRITNVQVEIERLQGQQRLLEDQASFATLAITVGEPGSERLELESNDGLGNAWDDARRRFGDSLEAIVSWSGSAAVVLIVVLLGLVIGRLAWVGVRRRMV
ncbi:MAG: DUF4349 domain-containing protein [Microthrixaceae bacterium]